ncbi:VOC family protein [Enhygromyxa salina]|uniref:Glyoxalase-like domain protein n=1 Tax=Enhygromyxa salina TaxID=215803 RepID=A0A2S9YX97_9BACT|nr:VOC family protein [Enhygromyxa salina]PRQ09692.1 Glyoxalase-like domain protein [Enhygromyxa salina]
MKKKPLLIQGLHHNAYRCRNAEQTRAFYEDFLGLPLACSLRREVTETGEETPLLHIFFEMRDGSYLAFFDVPDLEFDFKDQEPSDLHIALEVDERTLKMMYDKGIAEGIGVHGPAQLEYLKSIYFRDPNGYIIELTIKTEGYEDGMDPSKNRAREILDQWEADKAAG